MLPILLPAAIAGAGVIGSALQKKPSRPDISGELDKIEQLFAQLRAQNTTNINRQAAQGRSASASNLASRGTLRSGVAEHVFGGLEGERLNAIATSDANLAGQEAGMRSQLLRTLLGLDADAAQRQENANAGRWGALTGIGSNLLLAQLMRGNGATA